MGQIINGKEVALVIKEQIRVKNPPKLTFSQKKVKDAVRTITQQRIASGEIVRKPCRVCGNSVVDAHHFDYRTPRVIFLCRKHHCDWHSRQRYFDHLRRAYGMKFVSAPHQFKFKWVWVKNHMAYRPKPAESQPSVIVRGQKLIKVI